MKSEKNAFTLVELLVVIAIISILAAIVVPNVSKWIDKAHVAKATAEVQAIDIALLTVMRDVGVSNTRALFKGETLRLLTSAQRIYESNPNATHDSQYNSFVLYELLRRGKDAGADITPQTVNHYHLIEFADGVREKLGSNYMDLGPDPWGSPYNFIPGSWPISAAFIQLRSFRLNMYDERPDVYNSGYVPFMYDADARTMLNQKLPGNPKEDNVYGFPAPKDLGSYVWSNGKNKTCDQIWNTISGITEPGFDGGGDDINNWDNQMGWEYFYG